MNFVFTSLHSWNWDMGCNAKHIAEHIAKDHNVLYVNPPLDLVGMIKGYRSGDHGYRVQVLRGSEPAIKKIGKRLWLLEPPILLSSITGISSELVFDIINKRNNRKTAKAIEWAMQNINMSRNNLIHFNDNDIFNSYYLKEFLSPKLSLYYRRDNLVSIPYWNRHGSRLEPSLAHKSDAVISNSECLAETIRQYNLNTFNIGQGANVCQINQTGHPTGILHDLQGLQRPIIGCIGNLGVLHNSPNLIHRVACEHPECSIILIGPEDKSFAHHTLHELPNVHFLGVKKESEVSKYISEIDILINPLTINELTSANYSPHIDECLAYGKPVVSMRTDSMDTFYLHVYLADDEQHFTKLINVAIHQLNNKLLSEQRIQFAQNHSWDACTQRIYSIIDYLNAERKVDPRYSSLHGATGRGILNPS